MNEKVLCALCDRTDFHTHDVSKDPVVQEWHQGEQIRRKHPFTRQCSSCQADIVWFKTAKGKRMPVDEITCKPTDREDQLDLSRHKSHFATCPNAGQHRRS